MIDLKLVILEILLFVTFEIINGEIFILEAEDYVSNRFKIHRDSASGHSTINFNKGQSLNLYFCLRFETQVALHDVKYSNDGGPDTFEVSIDGYKLGTVVTPEHSGFGQNWDMFMSSDQLGPIMTLQSGRHKVTLNFTQTDYYGVEVDNVQLMVQDSRLGRNLFDCALYCVPNIHYDNGPARDDVPSATAVRKILPSTCPLEDNLLIYMYHENIEFYLITASLPKYRSFENNHGQEEGSCDVALNRNILWKFTNVKLPLLNTDDERFAEGALITYKGSNMTRSESLVISFKSIDPEDEFDKGTVLFLRMKEPTNQMYIQFRYRGLDSDWSEPEGQFINLQQMEATMTIPTKTWSTTDQNQIEIFIFVDPDSVYDNILETIELRRRRIEAIRETDLFNKLDTQIKSVEIVTGDPSESQEKMTIRRRDTEKFVNSSSYLSIMNNTPWSKRNSEILRLYQTGLLYLIPMTPHGLESVPFGSGVVVGQSQPDTDEPLAPIEHVEIDPGALLIYITYKDGGQATLLVKPQLQQTQVIVKDVKLQKDPFAYPFATVKSMWQYDGNSEVDHVSTNGNVERHVINGWEKLYGTSFAFFRKCISRHNTQSPDLQIKVLTEEDFYKYV
ncbi:hypothetical protein FSP39_001543 [Pinctada imbricata]|uniref:Uncharacterized protein n=1 Tax=Pinctada imbricata TaxID=66713 RepID=A0AA88XP46_PINIB|nr:hypothetical protein FSP39_001543 [Pinctada imbricata]